MQTRISDKGQVVVPKSLRDELGWLPGTDLEVIRTAGGVLLRERSSAKRLTVQEAVAKLRSLYQHEGPPVPVEQLSWSPDVDDDEA